MVRLRGDPNGAKAEALNACGCRVAVHADPGCQGASPTCGGFPLRVCLVTASFLLLLPLQSLSMLLATYAAGGVELCAFGRAQVAWLPQAAAAQALPQSLPDEGEGQGKAGGEVVQAAAHMSRDLHLLLTTSQSQGGALHAVEPCMHMHLLSIQYTNLPAPPWPAHLTRRFIGPCTAPAGGALSAVLHTTGVLASRRAELQELSVVTGELREMLERE